MQNLYGVKPEIPFETCEKTNSLHAAIASVVLRMRADVTAFRKVTYTLSHLKNDCDVIKLAEG